MLYNLHIEIIQQKFHLLNMVYAQTALLTTNTDTQPLMLNIKYKSVFLLTN